MALRLLTLGSRLKGRLIPLGAAGAHHEVVHHLPPPPEGTREMVGFGVNGEPLYMDRVDFPMPSLRWKEDTPDVLALREREKGDWRKLTKEEKKAIYRASFCQTFSEFTHPTGELKGALGCALMVASLGIWLYILMKFFVYQPLPNSFKEENRQAQFRRMLDLKVNPITGISSKWDFEKDDWKK